MSSTISIRLNRANNKSMVASPANLSSSEFRERIFALAPTLAVTADLITLLGMTSKLFFTKLVLSSFIILALVFCKASAAPRK